MVALTFIEGKALRQIVHISIVVAVVAFFLHVPWEFAHSVLYECFPNGADFVKGEYLAMHFRAAIGDAGLTLLLLWTGVLLFRSMRWWERLTRGRVVWLVLGGALVAIAVEYHAVFVAQRWVYAAAMPTVFGVGISPVAQMAFLPLLTMIISRRFLRLAHVY